MTPTPLRRHFVSMFRWQRLRWVYFSIGWLWRWRRHSLRSGKRCVSWLVWSESVNIVDSSALRVFHVAILLGTSRAFLNICSRLLVQKEATVIDFKVAREIYLRLWWVPPSCLNAHTNMVHFQFFIQYFFNRFKVIASLLWVLPHFSCWDSIYLTGNC